MNVEQDRQDAIKWRLLRSDELRSMTANICDVTGWKGVATRIRQTGRIGDDAMPIADLLIEWATPKEPDLARAAWMLDCYIEHIKRDIKSADFESHPYLPEMEGMSDDLKAAAITALQSKKEPGG